MVWLPDGEKKFDDIFIRFDTTHERDRHTDTKKVKGQGDYSAHKSSIISR